MILFGPIGADVRHQINHEDLPALDKAEGKDKGYRRIDDFKVKDPTTGKVNTVITYLSTDPDNGLVPFDWYVALVVAGYLQAGLPKDQIYDIALHSHSFDSNRSRKGCREATKAIEQDGFGSIENVLTKLREN